MSVSVDVRPAMDADLASIFQMDRETPEVPHWPESLYTDLLSVSGSVGNVKSRLLVAVLDGTIAGYAVGRVVGDEAELETVAVAASFRRLGIGRELCAGLMAWSRLEGASVMRLEVRSQNDGPQSLYTQLGFRIVGRRPAYYRLPEDDAVLMQVTLAVVDEGRSG